MYSEQFLDKVRSFGVLGYSCEKIIDLVEPDNIVQFRVDFHTETSEVFRAYRKGRTTGEYNADKELFDQSVKGHNLTANNILNERKQKNKINELINCYFGL
ncbi:MAG: hypothetical protein LBS50_08520 [Prevotellaceae bacterium]|nr:hypothetical protein [Prevotellaceae bacterium]